MNIVINFVSSLGLYIYLPAVLSEEGTRKEGRKEGGAPSPPSSK
jgi:hypothetical protein